MALTNFRQDQERFSHIDARFNGFDCDLERGVATYAVDLYPWWEHPLLLEAIRNEKGWGFNERIAEGYQTVTVHARGVRTLRVSPRTEVVDWGFYENHPLLWPYESATNLMCNSPLALEAAYDVAAAVSSYLELSNATDYVLEYLNIGNVRRFGAKPPFSLGHLPRPVFLAVRDLLREVGVETFAPSPPLAQALPVLFLIDDDDYIVADDFDLDVPEFSHRDEWFSAAED